MRTSRILFFVLICCLVFSVLIRADDSTGTNFKTEQVAITSEDLEIVAARTMHMKRYRTNTGTTKLYYSNAPLHYLDEQGNWQEIDTSLEYSTDTKDDDGELFAYKSVKNLIKTYLPNKAKNWVQVQVGDSRVAFKLANANNGIVDKNQNKIRYIDALVNSDLTFTVGRGELKEAIILKGASSPTTFEYIIRLHNLTMSKNDTGGFVFSDTEGNPRLIMPKFVMFDAKGSVSEDINVQLEQKGNGYRLQLTPDMKWLTSPERVYPIIIDPTIHIFEEDITATYRGHNIHYYFYFPTNYPTGYTHTDRGGLYSQSVYINNPGNITGIKTYDRLVKYTVQVGSVAGSGNWDSQYSSDPGTWWTSYVPPYFSFKEWNPANNKTTTREYAQHTFYYQENSYPQIYSGSFTLLGTNNNGTGAVQLDVYSGFWKWEFIWTHYWGLDVAFTIEYQNETMSPPPPAIKPLPPDTYGNTVTFSWNAPTDEANNGVLADASGISGYHVQRATDANFTTGIKSFDVVSGVRSINDTGLSYGTTYYYRVYAKDVDWNPMNTNPWDKVSNPSGIRWSEITRTKCVQAPLPGGPAKPTIVNISSDAGKPIYSPTGSEYYTAEQNPRVYWSSSATGQLQAQLSVVEIPRGPKTVVEYPIINVNSADTSALTNWNLPDDRYVIYVRVANNVSWSEWSEGVIINIDTVRPSIQRITETTSGNTITFTFPDGISEPVKYNLYWGENPDNLAMVMGTTSYDLFNAGSNIVYNGWTSGKQYYYYFEFTDKAQNTTKTPVYAVGANNIANADASHYGVEGYWNYQSIGLGQAGNAQVNLNNGNLVISATDFALPGRGISLAMTRYYNSLATYEGMLGKGWRTTYEMYLEVKPNNDVVINDPDGSSHTFTFISYTNDPQFTRPNGDYRKVKKDTANGTYTVTEKNGTKYNFLAAPNGIAKLKSIEDRFGNLLTLTYGTDGTLSSVTEPSGYRTANFHYTTVGTKKLLERVDFTPYEPGVGYSRYVAYSYLTEGNTVLTHVRRPYDGSLEIDNEYGYDTALGLMMSSVVYLCDKNTKQEQLGSRKNDTTYAYKSCTRSIAGIASAFKTYQENFSDALTDNPSQTVNVIYRYDYNGPITTVTDPRGGVYTYEHYANGQLKSVKAPTQTYPITYAYDADYNVKTITQKKLVYENGAETPRDVVTEYNYYANGNLASAILDEGFKNLTTSLTYETPQRDVQTDIKSITDARSITTNYSYTYDTYGKLTKMTITSPDDYFIEHTFDMYGQRTDKDVKLKSSPSTSKYHFSYGYENGLLNTLTNAYGTTTYYYTVYGERKSILDANGIKSSINISPYTGLVDTVGIPINYSGPAEILPFEPMPAGDKFVYTYDVNGNKTSETDAKNHLTRYYYDQANHLRRVESPDISDGKYNSYNRYDANGNLLETVDYGGKHTKYEYDILNRRTKVKDGLGNVQEELVYDEANRVKISYQANQIGGVRNRTEYFYDSLDSVVYEKHYEGSTLKHEVLYEYDGNGNLTKKTVPISSVDETGTIITNIQYDALNRPKNIVTTCTQNSKYNQTVDYTYEAGQLKTMTISNLGGATGTYSYTYNYDAAQRLDTMLNPSGQKIKMDYYPGGQRKKKSLYNLSSDASPFMTVDYKYDAAYRLRNLDYRWQTYYLTMSYEYNEIDKIVRNPIQYNVNAPGVISFLLEQLPAEGRPTVSSALSGGYTNIYDYDDLGRMKYSEIYGINPGIKNGDPTGTTYRRTQKNTYDLIDANSNPLSKTTLSYDGTFWKGTYTTNSYNPLNQLSSTSVDLPEDIDYIMTPLYDLNGNQISEHYTDGRPDSIYQYGLDDQLIKSFSESSHEEKAGEEKDSNGNPIMVTCYNRTDKKYSYELGGALRRVRSVIHDSTNPFDIWNANYDDYFYYTHEGAAAERLDDVGRTMVFTKWGRELISCDNGNARYYYIQNIRGDVVMLVKTDGEVIAIRDYDATGQMLCQAPRDREPFGFTGGLDAGNGLWKLGARFYDSGKGSFIQQDRYLGDPSDPLSLNRYVYCGLDPVNFVDPTGFSGYQIEGGGSKIDQLLRYNMQWAEQHRSPVGYLVWVLRVRPHGEWDYKNDKTFAAGTYSWQGMEISAEDLGNLNYGLTGAALGMSEGFLLAGNAAVNIAYGSNRTPLLGPAIGDSYRDVLFIKLGYDYYSVLNGDMSWEDALVEAYQYTLDVQQQEEAEY